MIINLANYFFKYATTRCNLDLKRHKLNFFIYITLERYILDKYDKTIIDIGAFKQ